MKQFNLEEYLKNPNRKVVTKEGRSVRIICTDRVGKYPVVALVGDEDEEILAYSRSGKNMENMEWHNLFFAPEKHEGWVNIYKNKNGLHVIGHIFGSKEEAIENSDSMAIATCKIEWED